jgi:hypothetical protein
MDDQEARRGFVQVLRRIADILEDPAVPLPYARMHFARILSGGADLARMIGGEWRAEVKGDPSVLHLEQGNPASTSTASITISTPAGAAATAMPGSRMVTVRTWKLADDIAALTGQSEVDVA